MNRDFPVTLRRVDKNSIDHYVLILRRLQILPDGAVIPGDVTSMIRINRMEDLVDVYAYQREELRIQEKGSPVCFTIAGRMYTFDWDVANAMYCTIESWFWDLVDTTDSRVRE